MKRFVFAGAAPVITTAALATGLLAASSFAANRSVALNKEIETLEPIKGIVFWPDQAKSQKDLQKSISLEFSYCLPCAVVKGATAVPLYIKANKSYTETYSEDPGGDGPTYYADWSNKELLWFYKQFYTDFAAK